VVIDRTNMTAKGRKKYLDMVPKNYKKIAVVFNIPDDELQRRLKTRADETGKTIPSFVLENMLKSYQEPTLEEFDKIIFIEK
jgi:predicted kinase